MICNKANKKIIALMLVIILCVVFVGCEEKPIIDNSSLNINSTDNSSSELSDSSSDNTEDSSSNKNYTTNITFSAEDKVTKSENNVEELVQPLNCAELWKGLKGYYEKEATEKRNAIVNSSKNTDEIYTITGTKYYVSNSGNNDADGKSPATAFKDVEGLNSVVFKPGDAVLFERGGTFRINQSINVLNGVTYGAYGTGRKPNILGSTKNFAQSGVWKPTNKKNVWRADFPFLKAGCIVFDFGKEIGAYNNVGLDQLTTNLQFYHNEKDGVIYLYFDKGNPADFYESIEISPKHTAFVAGASVSNVTFDNLCIKYTANFALRFAYANKNINVTNCEFGFIGGTAWGGGGRFGNAIELWEACENVVIENNWFYMIWDAAVTWQGSDENNNGPYKNISFSNNLFEYNRMDIEFFDQKNSRLENFKIENNIMRFTSLGWSHDIFTGNINTGLEGCIRAGIVNMDYIKDVSIKNNIFDSPGSDIVNWEHDDSFNVGHHLKVNNNIENFVISGTKVFINQSLRVTENTVRLYEKSKVTNQLELEEVLKSFDKSSTAVAKWVNK